MILASEKTVKTKVGFMQGRLSASVDGKIQVFPWESWRDELIIAKEHGISLMEWTLDQDRLYENPLMTPQGRSEIKALLRQAGVRVVSLTGDCFMQAPFYKAAGASREQLLEDMKNIVAAGSDLGIRLILVPLVDGGQLENPRQEEQLKEDLNAFVPFLKKTGVMISLESDFPAERLKEFIAAFDPQYFGITYDIGNSAALGYDPAQEIGLYADRIVNVHVKDRALGGATVPLGTGNADIPGVFRILSDHGYRGNYILQTARATDGDDIGALCKYYVMVLRWLEKADE